MARPTKLTEELTQEICENIELGLSYILSCKAAGISFETFNQWMKKGAIGEEKKYADFHNRVRAAEAICAKNCLERIREAANRGTWAASAWLLERRYPTDYGKHDNINMKTQVENLNVNVDTGTEDADALRSEILRRLSLEAEPEL
jgi:hypothetical protein